MAVIDWLADNGWNRPWFVPFTLDPIYDWI